MVTAGHPTVGQLRQLLNEQELDTARRDRLFRRFGIPSAAVIKGLTNTVLDFIIREWDSIRGAQVLDYGCGVMPYYSAFAIAGAKMLGVDVGVNKNTHVQVMEEGSLPLMSASFEYVISIQVLEHVISPSSYLSEAYRVLKPGGKLLLTTHGLWPYHPTPYDYRRWTKSGLECELQRVGFQVEYVGHILMNIQQHCRPLSRGQIIVVYGRVGLFEVWCIF